ncbi:MAG: hypothetical protein N2047_01725, partial [Meiothermus sp.]|nr:hypothetical protein [Meiothermus sp.]
MQLSPGQIISGAIFVLLGAKMSQLFIESDNYSHISLVFANDLLGLLGLLGTAGLAAYKRKPWLAAGLALV